MGISNTTRIDCDYIKDGKRCPKSFILPDDPKLNTPGVQHTVSSKDAYGNTLFFCGPLHLVAHWVEFIKASPADKEKLPLAAKKNDSSLFVVPTQEQLQKMQNEGWIVAESNAGKAVEELETIPVPVPSENLNLSDEE